MTVDATVRSMLALAGIQPSEAEIEKYVDGFPKVREDLRSIYALPDLAAADGVLVFRSAD